MLEAGSWDPEMIEKITNSRWKAHTDSEIVKLEERNGDDDSEEDGVTRDFIPRDCLIHKGYLVKFGYTEKCGRCKAIQTGRTPTQHHTNACRDRIRAELEKASDTKKVTEAAARKNEYIAKQVDAPDEGGRSAIFGKWKTWELGRYKRICRWGGG